MLVEYCSRNELEKYFLVLEPGGFYVCSPVVGFQNMSKYCERFLCTWYHLCLGKLPVNELVGH